MTGEQLKNILLSRNYILSDVAKLLGMPQQNFSQTLNNTSDIKSGLLEKICLKLHVDMSFFYGGTEFMPPSSLSTALSETNDTDLRPVPKYLYDELLKEIFGYRVTINELRNKIRDLNLNRH